MQFAARPWPMLVPGIINVVVTLTVRVVSHFLTLTTFTMSLTHPQNGFDLHVL